MYILLNTPFVASGSSVIRGKYCGSGSGEIIGDALIRPKTIPAVAAIRLFDHYKFRSLQRKSTRSDPMALQDDDRWVERYYDRNNMKYLERVRLCSLPTYTP